MLHSFRPQSLCSLIRGRDNYPDTGGVFDFRIKLDLPETLNKEFLLVDLVNNLDRLAEDQAAVLERVKAKASAMKGAALVNAVRRYGTVGTKKLFAQVLPGERLEYT